MSRAKGRVCATCNAWKESPSNYQSPNMGECPPAPAASAAGRDERVAGDQEKRLVRGLARRLAALKGDTT